MIRILVFSFLILNPHFSRAQEQTLAFYAAWNIIDGASALQASSRTQSEALQESRKNAARHWLPKIYLDAKSYQTNDPGSSFFSLLSQRSLQQADFNLDAINQPDSRVYSRGALGVDLALYEGGMRVSQLEVLKNASSAQKFATAQIQIEQYAQAGLAYSSVAILETQKKKLSILRSEIDQLIKTYQLGSKSNLVGYSGLLGMKSLNNRLQGLLIQFDAQTRAHQATLSEMGLRDRKWKPEIFSAIDFIDRYFGAQNWHKTAEKSFKVEYAKDQVRASTAMAEIERARQRPRLGAFAEGVAFQGNRDTATSFSAGAYLQWNIYDPSVAGNVRVVKLKAMAAEKNAEALEQQEKAERAGLLESAQALRETIALLTDSEKILAEQSKIAGRLFQNGSMTALQFVEITNRRADLLVQKGEAELNLVKFASQAMTKEKFAIPSQVKLGENHE